MTPTPVRAATQGQEFPVGGWSQTAQEGQEFVEQNVDPGLQMPPGS